MEDYLETILQILQEKHAVRAKEIATRMGVRSSSVTGALRMLADKGMIVHAPYDVITLTAEGDRLARDIQLRHRSLRNFFTRVLQIEPALADGAACQMEHGIPKVIHGIPKVILDRLIAYLTFVESCPNTRAAWDAELGFLCQKDCGAMGALSCLRVVQNPQVGQAVQASPEDKPAPAPET